MRRYAPRKTGFWVIYYDHDTKSYRVRGPVHTDLAVNERTVQLQKQVRNVTISTVQKQVRGKRKWLGPGVPNENAIHESMRSSGYKYDPKLAW